MDELLRIEDLSVDFASRGATLPVVRGVSLSLFGGRTLGLVGESGCGKSVTALSIMRLLPDPPAHISGGTIHFRDLELTGLGADEMRTIRGRRISMVFQEPMTSLNPVFTVGDQVGEVFRVHLGMDRRESLKRAIEMLATVGIPDPSRRARNYPHEMSGGMRQRVLIAIALACRPEILIADEPTTALDVTVQAQILELMERLRDEMGTAVLLITHDFGVVAEAADEVAVMYAGQIVEQAPSKQLFSAPWHPYTTGLLRSRPSVSRERDPASRRLETIPGTVPSPGSLPAGCSFEPRCGRRQEICRSRKPPLEKKDGGQLARCWVPPEGEER